MTDRRRAFTLLEMVVVLALISIMLVPLAMYEQKLKERYYDVAARNSASQEAEWMAARLERDLKGAPSIALEPRRDGIRAGAVQYALTPGGDLARDGRSLNHETRVSDFVAYADGRRIVFTLEVTHAGYQHGRVVRWKIVRDVPVQGKVRP